MGPFSYAAFFVAILSFEQFDYDMRTSGQKLMGFVCYAFILLNRYFGDSYVALDLILFLFASFFFYRSMTNNFDQNSVPGLTTIGVAALLIAAAYWQTKPATASAHVKSKTEIEAEAAMKAILQQAQQATEGLKGMGESPRSSPHE